MSEKLSIAVFLAAIMTSTAIFMLPLYFAFVYNPFCLLLFMVSWIPSIMILKFGQFLADSISGRSF